MKKYDQIRKVVEELFKDAKSHNINEVKEECKRLGIDLESDRNAISNVVFKMKKNNILRSTGEKGVYEMIPPSQVQDAEINSVQEHTLEQTPRCTQNSKLKHADRLVNLNWNDFFILKPDNMRFQEMRLTITDKGEMRFNTRLNKSLPNRKVQIIFSKDYRIVLLNPGGDDAHVFTKAGTAKNRELAQVYQKLKMKFPVGYIVKWDEDFEMWRGKLDISDKK